MTPFSTQTKLGNLRTDNGDGNGNENGNIAIPGGGALPYMGYIGAAVRGMVFRQFTLG